MAKKVILYLKGDDFRNIGISKTLKDFLSENFISPRKYSYLRQKAAKHRGEWFEYLGFSIIVKKFKK